MPNTPGTVLFPGALDDQDSLFQVANNATTTLNGSIGAGDLSITVTSGALLPSTGAITLVDSITSAPTKIEHIYYTANSSNVLTVPSGGRGADGSTAQSWSGTVYVRARVLASHHTAIRNAVIAVETKLGTSSSTPSAGKVLRATGTGTSAWGAVVDADISASAAITLSKLAAVTASRALVSDVSGVVSASAVTATELGYLSGVTSAIQTQISAKAGLASPVFTGTPSAPSLALTGTAGAGFVSFASQSSAPGAPGSGFSVFADSAGRFSWVRASDGFVRKWDATLTADRTYTLPDISGTVITSGNLTAITTTGTITSGTWNGSVIGAAYGGTGLDTSASTGVPLITAGVWSVLSTTGTGNVVRATSPTLVTPALGTPSAAVLTNATGLPLSTGVTGTLGVANGGTGQSSYTDGQLLIGNTATGLLSKATLTAGSNVTITNGNGTITIAATGGGGGLTVGSSAISAGTSGRVLYDNAGVLGELATTGSGSAVLATSPNLTTPTLGVATATSINKIAFTAPATGATLTLADGSTLATSGANSITFTSTGATNVTLPTSGTLVNSAVTSLSSLTTVGTITSGGLGTGAVIGGVTMTLGTDATGDIYYRNSGGVLTRLAIGSSGNVLTVSGGLPTWSAAGGSSGANPTASVGLSAVNGVASTYMRSDAAPALDVTIAPTWTGIHTFNNGVTTGSGSTAGTQFVYNSLTTGNGSDFSSSSVSSGNVVKIAATGTAAASNTKTALSVATSGANATSTQTTYAGQFSNTSTGTSSTNIGIKASASGGSTNYAIQASAGKVVVGSSDGGLGTNFAVSNGSEALGAGTVTINGSTYGGITGYNGTFGGGTSLGFDSSGNVAVGTTGAIRWGLSSSQNYGAAENSIGSVSGSVTVDWNNGNFQKMTMTGNVTTLTFSNTKAGAFYVLQLVQDATGGRNCAKPSNVIIPGGASGGNITGLTATANAKDELWCRSNGTTTTCFVVADVKN